MSRSPEGPAGWLCLLTFLGCQASEPASRTVPVTWPDADELFRSDPRWLGGDAAFSIPLGGDRTLWLFGDSFVGEGRSRDRREATFVRNTAAIQTGLDPASGRIEFAWREVDGRPSAFLPADGEIWRWPSHGIVLEGELTLFAWRMERVDDTSFGFRAVGWDAFRVAEPTAPIGDWRLEPLAGFTTPFSVILGVAVLEVEGHVHAYAVQEPGNHDVCLLRWTRDDFLRGTLTRPEWYGPSGWFPHVRLEGAPPAVIENAHTEFSVHRAPDGRYVQVQSEGFGASRVVARTAPRPEGPWSSPVELTVPPESSLEGVLVYAGKAHPELDGAPLVVTYATNAAELERLVTDDALYYPRFLRLAYP